MSSSTMRQVWRRPVRQRTPWRRTGPCSRGRTRWTSPPSPRDPIARRHGRRRNGRRVAGCRDRCRTRRRAGRGAGEYDVVAFVFVGVAALGRQGDVGRVAAGGGEQSDRRNSDSPGVKYGVPGTRLALEERISTGLQSVPTHQPLETSNCPPCCLWSDY